MTSLKKNTGFEMQAGGSSSTRTHKWTKIILTRSSLIWCVVRMTGLMGMQ